MSRLCFLVGASLLGLLLSPNPLQAQNRARAIHGATDAQYQAWVNESNNTKTRPVFVSAVTIGNNVRFSAIAMENPGGTEWLARHDLSEAAFQKEFDSAGSKGFRLISIAIYTRGNDIQIAGIWVKDGSKQRWAARIHPDSAHFQQAFNDLTKDGYRLSHIAGCKTDDGHRLVSIFVADGVKNWVARNDLTADQYQKTFDEYAPKDYHPVCVAAYGTAAGTRFAVVMIQEKGVRWESRNDLSAADYQARFDEWTAAGLTPIQVCGYPWQGDIRFACVFQKIAAKLPEGPLPMTGKAVAELAAFDDAIQKFMHQRNIQTATLTLMQRGKIVLERGYGWLDEERTHLCGPQTPMRIASISKPVTLAALRKLLRTGKLDLKTKPFVYLAVQPPPGATMDKRLTEITIQDLIDHKGGWDRDKAGDPMFMSLKIARALGIPGPPTPAEIITYMAGQPLQFNPGSKSVYSNFGYCVLGRVIEKATGKKYIDYVHEAVTEPLGLKSIQLGRSLPKLRSPKEPIYLDPGFGPNVMIPGSKGVVPSPDGTFCIESMDAHGGLLSSAPDLARFLQAYWISGQPRRAGEVESFIFFGSLPGTHTMAQQRRDGLNIVALFNQRADSSGLSYDAIEGLLNKTADAVKKWPGS
jgi:CubicO group peptidase (beta-lactamase class C family)